MRRADPIPALAGAEASPRTRSARVEVARLSRITVILIRPGYSISFSTAVAISCEISAARSSSTSPGSTITRISRPARIANTRSTPWWREAISSRSRRRPTYCSSASPRAPGPGAGDRVGGLHDHRLDRARLDLAVVGLHRVGDRLRLAAAAGDLAADERVRALDLVGDRLADVVQERGPARGLHRGAELLGHQRREVRALDQVVEHVLAVAGAVAKLAEQPQRARDRGR